MSLAVRSRVRAGDALAVGILLATLAVGVAAYRSAPQQVVVHWSLGYEQYYHGVRTLPRWLGLFAGTLVAAVTFAVLRALPLVDDLGTELAPVRWLYDGLVVLAVAFCCAVQLLVVVLNVV
ncbi:hypothetical protein [Halorarius halobius]|uniref:hypothetical protein n=1 Tax=Halorarius halobius TaxID=2962671 RepID=UPI0020CCFBE2|nr:hypothetical protein [Halorarius halobius]